MADNPTPAKKIVVYPQPGCAPCHRAMEFLTKNGFAYESKDVAVDEKAAEELMQIGSMSTPTIVVDGKVLVGFQPQRLLDLLKA
jgi:glutaredoxin